MPVGHATLVSRYAERFADAVPVGHVVASPFGVWLLLAILAPTAPAGVRERLEEVLGVDADTASSQAAALLSDPHPAVGVAAAVWARLALVGAAVDVLVARLPGGVGVGDMPSQAAADAWAAQQTRGLIGRFPLELTEQVAVVLASVLATDVSWEEPFDVVRGRRLGGQFGRRRKRALQAHDDHDQLLADTEAAGLVAVHAATGKGGLQVVSVIAHPSVPRARVLVAGGQIAALLGGDDRHAREVSLFEVPLGSGHAWDITESQVAEGSPPEVFFSFLPAWSARSDLDLAGMPGVEEAFTVLQTLLRSDVPSLGAAAQQSVMARFTREGFVAAAVTAMGQPALAVPQARSLMTQRTATVRFNRPYAALAVCRGGSVGSAWDGVPVFCAWVATADEAEI